MRGVTSALCVDEGTLILSFLFKIRNSSVLLSKMTLFITKLLSMVNALVTKIQCRFVFPQFDDP